MKQKNSQNGIVSSELRVQSYDINMLLQNHFAEIQHVNKKQLIEPVSTSFSTSFQPVFIFSLY